MKCHSHVPLPGLDIIFFQCNQKQINYPNSLERYLCEWGMGGSYDYYCLVYRRVMGTTVYLSEDRWIWSGLSLGQVRHLAQVTKLLSPEQIAGKSLVCLRKDLSKRCAEIVCSSSLEKDEKSLSRIAGDSRMIWLADSTGRVSPFLERGGAISPSHCTRMTIRDVCTLLREITACEKISKGFYLHIMCIFHMRSLLPANLRLTSKDELRRIIETRIVDTCRRTGGEINNKPNEVTPRETDRRESVEGFGDNNLTAVSI